MGASAQQPSVQSSFGQVWKSHLLLSFSYAVAVLMSAAAQQPSLQNHFGGVQKQHSLFRCTSAVTLLLAPQHSSHRLRAASVKCGNTIL